MSYVPQVRPDGLNLRVVLFLHSNLNKVNMEEAYILDCNWTAV